MNLTCRVKSSPKSKVSWHVPGNRDKRYAFNLRTIRQENDYSIVEMRLTVSGVNQSDHGLYRCLANNTLSIADVVTKLIILCKGLFK